MRLPRRTIRPTAVIWRRLSSLVALLALCLTAPVPALDPRDPHDPKGPYVEAYLAGEYHRALEQVEEAVAGEFGLPPVLWAADQAELLHIVGRYDEALTLMSDVVRRVYEPVFTVRLAAFYRHAGKEDDVEYALQQAARQSMSEYRQEYPRENWLAMAVRSHMMGGSPRQILQAMQQNLLRQYPDFIPGFITAGELALESYGYDVAEEYFLRALELDATRQSALSGLAETYYRAEDPRFEEIASALEALNPNHPRLLTIYAERALMAGDAESAAAVLDRLMAINPVHHAGLAYRAAAAFLQDDAEAQGNALTKLNEVRPDGAEGYRILGDLAARRYRFEEAVTFLRKGLEQNPEHNPAKASLALNLLRLGEDDSGRELLDEVFEEDPYNVQVYNMLEVLDTLDGFESISNSEFVIRLPGQEAAVMGAELLSLLSEALGRYSEEYGMQVKRPTYVQLFDDHDDFMVRSIGLPGNPGHLGICFGNLVTLDSPRARDPRSMNWRSVLWHEFVHVITLQKTGNRIPRWFSEGISVYEEGQKNPAWGQPLDPEFQPLLSPEDWPKLTSLENYFVKPESPNHLMLGYFLAGEFVTAYVDAYGKGALVASLDAMGEGRSVSEALLTEAGADEQAINKVFADHLSEVCAPLWDISPGSEFARRAEGELSFLELVEAGFTAVEHDSIDEAINYFEQAAESFPDFPGDRNPLRHLVAVRRQQGDLEQWFQAVVRLQQHDPTAYEETAAVMDALEEDGQWQRVAWLAEWCAGVDPFDVDVCKKLQRAQEAVGDTEGLVHTLDRLAALDPELAESYQLAKARALHRLQRSAEARYLLLTLLEAYPEYRAAQQLLLELHEQGLEVDREDS